MIFLFLFLLIIAVFLEGTVTVLPLVFICLLCMTIFMRNVTLFFLAFLAGMFLDAFALRLLGQTSLFLLISVFLILLYQRKYEINSYPFVLIASFVGSLVYLFIFGYQNIFVDSVLCAVIAVILFGILRYLAINFKFMAQDAK